MRVDFKAEFSEVLGRVRTPAQHDPQKAERTDFGLLLGDLSQESAQTPNNTKVSSAPFAIELKPTTEPPSPMARYNFAPPSMHTQEPRQLSSMITPLEDANPMPESVKTPTLIEAKRVARAAPAPTPREITQYKSMIETKGQMLGIDPALGKAVAQVESSFNPAAISSDGHESKGLFQLLDGTGRGMLSRTGNEQSYEPFNPELNSELGIGYLRHLHELFTTKTALANGSVTVPAADSASLEKLAVAAFNAGEGRVAAAQERAKVAGKNPAVFDDVNQYLPETTQRYVRMVSQIRDENTKSNSVEEG